MKHWKEYLNSCIYWNPVFKNELINFFRSCRIALDQLETGKYSDPSISDLFQESTSFLEENSKEVESVIFPCNYLKRSILIKKHNLATRDRPQVSSEWSRSISSLLQIRKITYIRSFVLIRGEFGKTFAQPVHSKRYFNHLRLVWFVKEVTEHFVELSGSSGTRMFFFIFLFKLFPKSKLSMVWCQDESSYLW